MEYHYGKKVRLCLPLANQSKRKKDLWVALLSRVKIFRKDSFAIMMLTDMGL